MGISRLVTFVACVIVLWMPPASAGPLDELTRERPNILLITVDTLRADHLSIYGYPRPTSPNLDELLGSGVHFTQARTVEPLTNPAMSSMLTSRHPSVHGATRNGLRMRPGLTSLTKVLEQYGYRTAGFVGSWTLRDKLSGLGEHFDEFEEVITRRRWFGLIRSEANATDLNAAVLEWVDNHKRHHDWRPFFVWVHYVEPHAPYRFHKPYRSVLGTGSGAPNKKDRYDTEIAFVDAVIGDLLRTVEGLSSAESPLILFASDHGESLGEHGYWGHGRNLHEPSLRIPMAIRWKDRLPARQVDAPALITDLAPTTLSLLGMPVPDDVTGFDWKPVLEGAPPPRGRVTTFEAHRGAVMAKHRSERARKAGLLELGVLHEGRKELYRVKSGERRVFDLKTDPGEVRPLVPGLISRELMESWIAAVRHALRRSDELPSQELDEESIAALRSLGYVD